VGAKGVFMTNLPRPSKPQQSSPVTRYLKIFQHPTSHNIEWRNVISLLEVVGTVEEGREGKFRVASRK